MNPLARLLGVERLVPADRSERALATGSLVSTFGNGLLITVSALYFTRVVGISMTAVGLSMSIAAAVGILSVSAFGRLADLRDPRAISIVFSFLDGLAVLLLLLADNAFGLTVALSMAALSEGGGKVARSVVMSRLGGPEGQVRIRAFQRMVVNAGIGAGALGGGIGLAIDQPWAYRTLIVLDALSFMIQAALYLALPQMPPHPAARHARATTALRDRNYVLLSAVNAVSCLHYTVGEIAVPLWVAFHTTAPTWVVAASLFMNTAAVVVFQVRMSRGVETPVSAASVSLQAGVLLALGMMVYATATLFDSPWWATAAILLGAAIHVAGELRQAAASWAIGYGLPPEHLQGQYQAVWGLGFSIEKFVAPVLLTSVVIAGGVPGWALLAGLFLLAGWLNGPLVHKALAARPA